MEKLLHSVPEALETLSLGRTKFYEEVRAGRITIVKIGDRSLVPYSSLQQYIEAKIAEARAGA